jgi:hypothetical protein
MHEALVAYFQGEKQSALAWGAAGVIAVVVALGVWRLASEYRAFAIPVVIFGVIQLGLAASLALRTDGRVARYEAELRADAAKVRESERGRIRGINRAFVAIECVEIAVWLTGVALAFAGHGRARATMLAVGMGLALQASAMLVLDLAAHRRSNAYAAAIDAAAP